MDDKETTLCYYDTESYKMNLMNLTYLSLYVIAFIVRCK